MARMLTVQQRFVIYAGAIMFNIVGCDRSPTPPAQIDAASATAAPTTEPASERASRPTTQALMDGPRRTMPLGDLPLTIALPAGWSAQDLGGRSVLSGPTPSGVTATLLASRQPDVSDASLKFMLDGATQDATAHPDRYLAPAASRQVGAFTVLERVTRIDLPAGDTTGRPPSLRVEETLFYPAGEDPSGVATFHVDDVRVLGLTAPAYAVDGDFIRSLVNGIHVAAP